MLLTRELFFSPLIRSGLRRNLNSLNKVFCSTKSAKVKRAERTKYKFEPLGGSPLPADAFGQPTHFTHPHHLSEGEITPGIHLDEFCVRRHKLLDSIEMYSAKQNLNLKSHIVIVPAAGKKFMTEKIPYVFRQNSDFLYLTGCLEPDSVLVLITTDKQHKCVLFLRGKDPAQELWDGPRTGVDQGALYFGMDTSLPTSELDQFITAFLKENKTSMLWYDYISDTNPTIHAALKESLSHGWSQAWNKLWESPKPLIHKLRLYKSPAEQRLMRKTCEIGGQAIAKTIQVSKPGMSEAQVWATVDYECRMRGAQYLAYPPVVAAGRRANIIHYINNDQLVANNDMVLMDAGCEYHGYSSDITRCWPMSGKFSPAQRALYEMVLSVQMDLIAMCASLPTLDHLYKAMCKLLGRRLVEAGVVSERKLSEEEATRVAMSFCPHHVSHYLGMDIHDTGSITRSIPLEPGMVITVEPGVYVNENNKLANPAFHGLGVRVEDDVLITEAGPVVLTDSCPKHADQLQLLMSTVS